LNPRRDEWLVDLAFASTKVPERLARGSRALVSGVLLGLLSDAPLRALDERYYSETELYRTPAWNERGLFPWEQELVQDHFDPGGRAVVLACGGGREVLALLRSGYDAVGFESHPALAAFGEAFLTSKGYPHRIACVARDSFPADVDACDGVVIGWGAYSLVHSRARRVALLQQIRPHLVAHAPVLLSFFERPTDHREARWTKAIADTLRRVRGADRIEMGDMLAPNLIHAFRRDEIAVEAAAAGFEVAVHRPISDIDTTTSYGSAVVRATS
jgi:hypothetical protein